MLGSRYSTLRERTSGGTREKTARPRIQDENAHAEEDGPEPLDELAAKMKLESNADGTK